METRGKAGKPALQWNDDMFAPAFTSPSMPRMRRRDCHEDRAWRTKSSLLLE
jgi:hypothetical protein